MRVQKAAPQTSRHRSPGLSVSQRTRGADETRGGALAAGGVVLMTNQVERTPTSVSCVPLDLEVPLEVPLLVEVR